ncbi:MAG: Lrp/AsnC family transcriptional regulator [Gammaproteobacteria bacterium]|nr:Lrp/AsnC family transcriptional regulator [Gammaproteobacteria bacterium]
MLKLDKYDKSILSIIQRRGRMTNQRMADQVSLSPAPCLRRVDKLESAGIIRQYVALADREKLGLSVLVYIHISLNDHHADTVASFNRFVDKSESILECYSVSGEYDYLIRVVAKDVRALESFIMEQLLQTNTVRSANTSFVLNEKKYTTALPITERDLD